MDIDARATEQLHIDQAVARARLFARLLNETLDELQEYGIECLDMTSPAQASRGAYGTRRVELVLVFKAKAAGL